MILSTAEKVYRGLGGDPDVAQLPQVLKLLSCHTDLCLGGPGELLREINSEVPDVIRPIQYGLPSLEGQWGSCHKAAFCRRPPSCFLTR